MRIVLRNYEWVKLNEMYRGKAHKVACQRVVHGLIDGSLTFGELDDIKKSLHEYRGYDYNV